MDDDRFRKAQEFFESRPPVLAAEFQEQQSHHVDDALLLTETALKLDPQNTKAQEIWKTLKRYKPQPGHAGEGTNNLDLGDALDKKGQTDDAIRQFQEALRLKRGYAAGHTDPVPYLGRQKHPGTLTEVEAKAQAEQPASRKAHALYNSQPFRNGPPTRLIEGNWVWHDLRAHRSFDVEATVKFAEDGTNPDVNVILLDSRPSFR